LKSRGVYGIELDNKNEEEREMSAVKWVEYEDLSNIQRKSVRIRYKPPYHRYLYRTWKGQLTQTGNDRRKR